MSNAELNQKILHSSLIIIWKLETLESAINPPCHPELLPCLCCAPIVIPAQAGISFKSQQISNLKHIMSI